MEVDFALWAIPFLVGDSGHAEALGRQHRKRRQFLFSRVSSDVIKDCHSAGMVYTSANEPSATALIQVDKEAGAENVLAVLRDGFFGRRG